MTITDALFTAFLAALLVSISVIDQRDMRIPDELNLLLLVLGMVYACLAGLPPALWALLSAVAGAGAMYLIRMVYSRLRQRSGLGLGDVKFVGAAGAWLGLAELPTMILLACLAAITYLAVIAVRYRSLPSMTERLPFGPFLCGGLFSTWIAQRLGP